MSDIDAQRLENERAKLPFDCLSDSDDDDVVTGDCHDVLSSSDEVEAESVEVESPPPVSVERAVSLERAVSDPNAIKPSVPYTTRRQYTGGRVRALLIGINYVTQKKRLKGCMNDVRSMLKALQKAEFPITECCILVEDRKFPGFTDVPTRANFVKYIRWLTSDLKAGDVLYFHYSGHGGQVRARGDKHEKRDQTVVPVDFRKCGMIRDNDMFKMLCAPLPVGVRLTCTFDSCHSGTILDLPFALFPDGNGHKTVQLRQNNYTRGDVIAFSGCSDRQTCSDVRKKGGAHGAATHAMSSAIGNTSGKTHSGVLREMHGVLNRRKRKQTPFLLSSKPVDMHHPFSLFGVTKVDPVWMAKIPESCRWVGPEELICYPQRGDKYGTPPSGNPPPLPSEPPKLPLGEQPPPKQEGTPPEAPPDKPTDGPAPLEQPPPGTKPPPPPPNHGPGQHAPEDTLSPPPPPPSEGWMPQERPPVEYVAPPPSQPPIGYPVHGSASQSGGEGGGGTQYGAPLPPWGTTPSPHPSPYSPPPTQYPPPPSAVPPSPPAFQYPPRPSYAPPSQYGRPPPSQYSEHPPAAPPSQPVWHPPPPQWGPPPQPPQVQQPYGTPSLPQPPAQYTYNPNAWAAPL